MLSHEWPGFVKIKQFGAVTASCRLVCQVFEVLDTYAFMMRFQPNEIESSGDAGFRRGSENHVGYE